MFMLVIYALATLSEKKVTFKSLTACNNDWRTSETCLVPSIHDPLTLHKIRKLKVLMITSRRISQADTQFGT